MTPDNLFQRRWFHIVPNRLASMKTLLFVAFYLLLVTSERAEAYKNCDVGKDFKEKVEHSNVIVSGVIERKYNGAESNGIYPCDLKVMLVFKGKRLVTSNKLKLNNDMLHVEGFGNDHICNSNVNVNDTKLFFLSCDGKTTKLESGIFPVTMETLQITEAIVKNRSYVPPNVRKTPPCENKFCPFGGECYVNTTSGEPYCKCITKCDKVFSPVCGSNMVSYSNECHMLRASCLHKKRITVLYNQPCDMKDPCEQKQCSYGAQCVPSLDGFSHRCQCPTRCNTYGDNIGSTPVCGNDGIDYDNMCEMRKAACQQMTDIRVKYYGKCDPCDGFHCAEPTVCQLDPKRKPGCHCNLFCPSEIATVCGSDGVTYSNDCYLRIEACKNQRDIKVYHEGSCDNRTNPCRKLKCNKFKRCNITRGAAECVCPTYCEPVLRPVCGSDGITYDNECQLQKDACQNERHIVIKQRGPCGVKRPCLNHHCNFYGVCVVRDGRAECDCPTCSEEFDPVCGMNGISYMNECKLKLENCQKRSDVQVKHKGLCNGCENKQCHYYAVCQSDGKNARCVCPSACVEVENKVCGTDRITYQNECELKVASCRDQKLIEVESRGDCDKCAKVPCQYGSTCEDGHCVCPQTCPADFKPLCASNIRAYSNECEMKRDACLNKMELYIINNGPCEETSGSGLIEGSGSGTECDENKCKYGGTCELTEGKDYRCTCKNSCDAIRSRVCGSDGRTYSNECLMKLESCNLQMEISSVSIENCEDLEEEEFCDGNMPLVNPLTGHDYNCLNNKNICPPGSYCHKRSMLAKCCIVDNVIERCSDSPFGCCEDGLTIAKGPNLEGCPSSCQCNPLGSHGTSCDRKSQQCVCKPGVGGLKCDRCKPGYWGMRKIDQGNMGCIPCDCNVYGSLRDDCEQNSGRCKCKPGITGIKCNRCSDNRLLGPDGCQEEPTSCRRMDCRFGAVCRKVHHRYDCICDFNCSGHPELVCGSDGQTYGSECQLKQFSCRLKKRIELDYRGICSFTTSSRMTTPLPPTTRSRKTTRHINHVSNEVTKFILTKATEKPPEDKIVGRIEDLCPGENMCDVPNSHCELGICVCNTGYIPTMDKKNCLEVVSVRPAVPHTNTTCTLNPCQNGGTCLMDETLGYRCLCPLGTGGSICKDIVSFDIPSFSGTSFLRIPVIKNATNEMKIEVEFKSLNKDGIILFNSQEEDGSGDFVSLTLNQGYVELRYDLGSGLAVIRSAKPIKTNKYHRIIAYRTGQDGVLEVDNPSHTSKSSSLGALTSLNLASPLYVGHIQNFTALIKSRIEVEVGLVGCVRELIAGGKQKPYNYRLSYPDEQGDIIDGVDVAECGNNPCSAMPCKNGGNCLMLDPVMVQCICQEGFIGKYCENEDMCINNPCQGGGTCASTDVGTYVCTCPEDRMGRHCEKEKEERKGLFWWLNDGTDELLQRLDVPEFNGTAYVELPLNAAEMIENMMVAVWFKAAKPDGMLFCASQYKGGEGDFIALNLNDRVLEFSFNLGGGTTKIRSSHHIELNVWNSVVIERNQRSVEMVINNEKSASGKSDGVVTKLNLSDRILIGGFRVIFDVPSESKIKVGFTGAIQRVYLNNKIFDNLIVDSVDSQGVTIYNGPPCKDNPCMNGGICVPKLNIAECHCHKQFTGHRCQEAMDSKMHIKFEGDTFLEYLNGLDHKKTSQQMNKFRLRFKTKKKNGLLFIMSNGDTVRQDYLAMAIARGKVQISYNLGAQTENNIHIIRSPLKINNNKWHIVEFERNQADGQLKVDDTNPVTGSSDNSANKLDTDGELWIGGKKSLPRGLPKEYYDGFDGCIDFFEIDGQRLNLETDRKGDISQIRYCR